MDSKTKTEAIITGFLLIFLAVLLTNIIRERAKKRSFLKMVIDEKKETFSPPPLPSETAEVSAQTFDLQKEHAKFKWGRDPFYKASEKVYEETALLLGGISLGEDGRGFALINNETVTVGDTVEGYKVIQIQKDRVILDKGGQNFYLRLPPE